jgi:hypothetical protein
MNKTTVASEAVGTSPSTCPSMQVPKESTTLALSGSAVFLGTGSSDYYHYDTNI